MVWKQQGFYFVIFSITGNACICETDFVCCFSVQNMKFKTTNTASLLHLPLKDACIGWVVFICQQTTYSLLYLLHVLFTEGKVLVETFSVGCAKCDEKKCNLSLSHMLDSKYLAGSQVRWNSLYHMSHCFTSISTCPVRITLDIKNHLCCWRPLNYFQLFKGFEVMGNVQGAVYSCPRTVSFHDELGIWTQGSWALVDNLPTTPCSLHGSWCCRNGRQLGALQMVWISVSISPACWSCLCLLGGGLPTFEM